MQKVLHVLFNREEERAFKSTGFGLDTHGIQHVMLQFERGYKAKPAPETNGVVHLNGHGGQKLLPKPKQRRDRTAECRWCHEKKVPQGLWKHEKFCAKNTKKKVHA